MTITELIKEGEEFRDSIGDSTHGIGKIQDSSKFYLWVERVVRYLGQTVPKDISIERFMHYSNQINPIHFMNNMICIGGCLTMLIFMAIKLAVSMAIGIIALPISVAYNLYNIAKAGAGLGKRSFFYQNGGL